MPSREPAPRPTTTGLVATTVTALTVAAGLLLLSGPLLAAGLAAALFLLLCRGLAGRHLAGFTVTRDLPRRARAGESFPMALRIGSGPAFPAGAAFRFTDPLAPAVRDRAVTAPGDGPASLRCTGLAHRRGPLPVRPWTLASTWPLGLFVSERTGTFRDDHATLVLPKPWLPAQLHDRLDRLSIESADRPLEPADPLSEFRLLREFRSGDPVRGIHWPSSLRSGRLQFAETEPPRPKPLRYGIFLHSHEPPGSVVLPENYETILRIAAGLLVRFQREEIPVVFCQAPGHPVMLRERDAFAARLDGLALSRRHPLASAERIFDATASAGPDPFRDCDEVFVLGDGPLAQWEDAARARFPRCTCLDTTTLTTGRRPGLLTRSRRP
jgi:hypothetical protein